MCLLLALMFAAFTWQFYLQHQNTLNDNAIQLKQSSIQFKSIKQPLMATVIAIEPKEIAQIQQIVSALTIPWNDLLKDIEQADMQNIVLLSLTPNLKKQQILLTGEAKDLATLLQYVKQLEMQPLLNQVYLQRHTTDVVNPAKPVSFSVLAKWKVAP